MKFVKLSSDSQLFRFNSYDKTAELIWDGALDLSKYDRVGLHSATIDGLKRRDTCQLARVKCNLLERTLWNPFREIGRLEIVDNQCFIHEPTPTCKFGTMPRF